MSAGAILALSALLAGAPRLPYGGSIGALVLGGRIAIDPAAAAHLADFTVAEAVFEPLYRVGPDGAILPVLAAGEPTVRPGAVEIRLRPHVTLHDGRALQPEHVATSLRRLLDASSLGSHVLLPVRGAREGAPVIRTGPGPDAITIELAVPYPELVRLLATPRAGIAVPAAPSRDGVRLPAGALAGTGPFHLAAGAPAQEVRLLAFLRHDGGRPFVDEIRLKPASSPLGAGDRLRRGEVALVLGPPELAESRTYRPLSRPAAGVEPPRELLVLALGKGAHSLRQEPWLSRIHSAIDRRRLAQRFLGPSARPATRLYGDAEEDPAPPSRGSAIVRMTMLVPAERGVDDRVAERVQLDLLKVGVTVVIERAADATLASKLRTRDFDLMLDSVLIDGMPKQDAADRLHVVLSLAAHLSRAFDVLDPTELAAFGADGESGRRARLAELESRFRAEAGLIPIATRTPSIWIRRTLAGTAASCAGAVVLDEAWVDAGAQL